MTQLIDGNAIAGALRSEIKALVDEMQSAYSVVPGLAGMPRDYMSTQLKAFKSGGRPATIMHQLSKGYSDAQIEQLATYFAAQKK